MILEQHKPTARHQRSAARKGSNTQHNNRTSTTSASSPPTKHRPRTAQHTRPPTKPSTNQPSHHATAVQQETDALFRARTSPQQSGYIAERTKYCCCTEENNSSTSHRHEGTHARTKRPPPTQPTARQPTNPSHHLTLQPIRVTAVQQYVPAVGNQLVRTQAQRRLVHTRFFFLKTRSWVRSTSNGLQQRVVTHPPTDNPPPNRYGYLLLRTEDTRTCDCNAHDQNKAPSVRFYYGVVVPFG